MNEIRSFAWRFGGWGSRFRHQGLKRFIQSFKITNNNNYCDESISLDGHDGGAAEGERQTQGRYNRVEEENQL